MDIFEEHPEFKDEDYIYDWCASMEVMYELVTTNKTFEEFLLEHTAIYTSNTTADVEVKYATPTENFLVYPFDPTNITKEDLKGLLKFYEDREEYEKCLKIMELLKK